MVTKSRHRTRWRITLRGLLLVMLVFGCGFGWLARELQRAREQRVAVDHIRSVRGHAIYEDEVDQGVRTLLARPLGHVAGRDLFWDVRLVSIHLAHDADLEHVAHLSGLRDLRLNSQHVTDEGLAHLEVLEDLERLYLWCDQVTDEGLESVAHLENLETLDLGGTQVTDDGLLQLRNLPRLRVLKVRNAQVTAAGARRLQALRPECEVLGAAPADQN